MMGYETHHERDARILCETEAERDAAIRERDEARTQNGELHEKCGYWRQRSGAFFSQLQDAEAFRDAYKEALERIERADREPGYTVRLSMVHEAIVAARTLLTTESGAATPANREPDWEALGKNDHIPDAGKKVGPQVTHAGVEMPTARPGATEKSMRKITPLIEGTVRKGGRNEPNTSDKRPPAPKGSGGEDITLRIQKDRAFLEGIDARSLTAEQRKVLRERLASLKATPEATGGESSTCPRCEGTGKYSSLGEPSRDCAVCNGTGKITAEPPATGPGQEATPATPSPLPVTPAACPKCGYGMDAERARMQ